METERDTATTRLRPATPADLPAILEIYNDAVLHTTASYDEAPSTLDQRAAWFAARVEEGFPVLVAERDGIVAGFGSYGPFHARSGYRFTVEHSVYVDSAYRGQGIGRALLVALIDHARRRRLHAMIASIDAEGAASLHLHESLGFVPVGHLREVGFKFGRWLDVRLLELVL